MEEGIMKKLLLMVICILIMLTGILPVVCAEDQLVSEQRIIGIIGAMDEEVTSLKAAVENPENTSIAGMEFCRGKLDGVDVGVAVLTVEQLLRKMPIIERAHGRLFPCAFSA